MFLSLIDQLKPEFLSKHKNLCQFFLSNLLMIHQDSFDEKISSEKINKQFKFKPIQFIALIKNSFKLVRQFKCHFESRVYFKFFKIFICVNYSNQKYL